MVNKEINNLKIISKEVVPRKVFSKIGKIKDEQERTELYKYSIKSAFDLILKNFELEFSKHRKSKDLFSLEAEVSLLNNKIRYFYTTYDRKDLEKILSKIKEIKKVIKKL